MIVKKMRCLVSYFFVPLDFSNRTRNHAKHASCRFCKTPQGQPSRPTVALAVAKQPSLSSASTEISPIHTPSAPVDPFD